MAARGPAARAAGRTLRRGPLVITMGQVCRLRQAAENPLVGLQDASRRRLAPPRSLRDEAGGPAKRDRPRRSKPPGSLETRMKSADPAPRRSQVSLMAAPVGRLIAPFAGRLLSGACCRAPIASRPRSTPILRPRSRSWCRPPRLRLRRSARPAHRRPALAHPRCRKRPPLADFPVGLRRTTRWLLRLGRVRRCHWNLGRRRHRLPNRNFRRRIHHRSNHRHWTHCHRRRRVCRRHRCFHRRRCLGHHGRARCRLIHHARQRRTCQ